MFRRLALTIFSIGALTAAADGEWLEKVHDFGAFDEEVGTVYCDFRLVNTGAEPMSIFGARANCGCTKPEYPREPIAPGDTAVVRVGFDPKGRPGRFSKYINVDLSTVPQRTRLTICGTVIGSSNTLRSRFPVEAGPMRLRAKALPYGKVYKGSTSGQYIEAYNASADTIRPVVTYSPKYIKTIVQPAAVGPGEQFIISTVFHADYTKLWGAATDSIVVLPNGPGSEPIAIETVAIISEDFSSMTPQQLADAPLLDTSTTAIDLERISRTDKPIKRSFEVKNLGKSPLIIRRISCPNPAVEVTMKETKIKPGKSAKVEVTVTPSLIGRTELLNARINIIANDPQHPSTMVRVVGELTD